MQFIFRRFNGCTEPRHSRGIIRQTLAMFPHMRQPLRAVSRFFRDTIDKQPLPKVYIPELNNILDIRHVSGRKIMLLKGKASGAVIRLREIINHVKWASAWISFVALGQGWFGISSIFWRNGKKRLWKYIIH